MKNKIYLLIIFSLLITISCEKENGNLFNKEDENSSEEQIKTKNFDSPEEYLENPSVSKAIKESDIEIYDEDAPPRLAGDYNLEGEVVDASDYSLVGAEVNSLITLYNQTASGKISFREKVGNITAWASGGYITGDNGKFTIWQESKQSGEEAGLPEDLTVYVSLIMSGTKSDDGNLHAKSIAIITDVQTTNSNYDIEAIKSIWWMVEGDYNLKGEASLNSAGDFSKSLLTQQLGNLTNY